jgi:hypothetical protein
VLTPRHTTQPRQLSARGVQAAATTAGLGKVTPKDLRASFCSLAGRRRVDPIEAAFPESLAVNRYVLTGGGDARRSLTSMQPYCWDCEEFVGLIEWLRRWNAGHDRKVRTLGCDLQTSWPA